MDSSSFKSVAINIAAWRQLRELADKKFEMPQSLAKTASYFIQKGFEDFKKNGKSSRS